MNKQTIITLSTAGLMLVGLATPKPTQAFWPFDLFKSSDNQIAQTDAARPNFMQSLIDKLSAKFNTNPEEVEAVFNQVRQEKRTYMQSQFQSRVEARVESGDLNQEQAELIMQKHQEIMANEPDWNQDPATRREEMRQRHEELKSWADENDIPMEFFGRMGAGNGRGMYKGQR